MYRRVNAVSLPLLERSGRPLTSSSTNTRPPQSPLSVPGSHISSCASAALSGQTNWFRHRPRERRLSPFSASTAAVIAASDAERDLLPTKAAAAF